VNTERFAADAEPEPLRQPEITLLKNRSVFISRNPSLDGKDSQ